MDKVIRLSLPSLAFVDKTMRSATETSEKDQLFCISSLGRYAGPVFITGYLNRKNYVVIKA